MTDVDLGERDAGATSDLRHDILARRVLELW